jgi:hypothetical protein
MADVMCPLRFEDFDALMADDQLPLELAALFEDSARTVELSGGYEMELTETEARAPTPRATSCATWSGTFGGSWPASCAGRGREVRSRDHPPLL